MGNKNRSKHRSGLDNVIRLGMKYLLQTQGKRIDPCKYLPFPPPPFLRTIVARIENNSVQRCDIFGLKGVAKGVAKLCGSKWPTLL